MDDTRARRRLQELGVAHTVVRPGPVRSVAEAAAVRGHGVRDPEFPEPPERWGVVHGTSLRRRGRELGPDPVGIGVQSVVLRGQAPVLGRPGLTGLGVTVVVGAGVGVTDGGTVGVGVSHTG